MSKADYTYEIVNGVLYIINLDLGNKSVTNDMQAVLFELKKEYDNLPNTIVYRDSMDIWDHVIHDNGRFLGIEPFKESDVPEEIMAVTKAYNESSTAE